MTLLPCVAVAVDPVYRSSSSMNGGRVYTHIVSMGAIAREIRNSTYWQILDARPRQNKGQLLYRFKLINKHGRVIIFTVNPKRPNLKKLSQ